MNINKKTLFPLFVLFSALGLAGCAAYYSIIGISTLFSGAFISVSIMALFLEIGKICSVSFSYRYWDKCKNYLKIYLVFSILVLMIITSAGISGMLMSAYQKSSIEFSVTQEKITSIQDQKVYYKDKIEAAKKRIDDLIKLRSSQETRMSSVLTNEFLSRNPLQLKQLQQQTVDSINDTDKDIKSENQKIQSSIEDIRKTDEQINQLKLGTAEKKDVQTFKFVAESLKLPLDTVARWFILLIIFVFGSLAICLILAYNVVVYKKDNESIDNNPKKDKELPKILKTIEPETIQPSIPTINEPKIEKVEQKHESHNSNMSDWFKQMFKI